jgi:outer membrane protein assembly factor BamE (lipoprotein component of BamABCDE complex)
MILRASGLVAGLAAIALLAGSWVLPSGCASRGARFDVDLLPRIERGVTTRAEIRAWFGRPVSERAWGSGGSTWRYFHEEETRHDTGMLRRIVRSIASIFGLRVFVPPLDIAYTNTVRHELEVFFDDEGLVEDYVYEREETPSKRVY